jgi:hypothetical protein
MGTPNFVGYLRIKPVLIAWIARIVDSSLEGESQTAQ